MSLKISKDAIHFCFRLERSIQAHCQQIFGMYHSSSSSSSSSDKEEPPAEEHVNGAASRVRRGSQPSGGRRGLTLDGSYIQTVHRKALRKLDMARSQVPERVVRLEDLVHWLAASEGDTVPGKIRRDGSYQREAFETYYPGKGIICAIADMYDWATHSSVDPLHSAARGRGEEADALTWEPAHASARSAETEVLSNFAVSQLLAAFGEQQLLQLLSGGPSSAASLGRDTICCPCTVSTLALTLQRMLESGSHFYSAAVLLTSLLSSAQVVSALSAWFSSSARTVFRFPHLS